MPPPIVSLYEFFGLYKLVNRGKNVLRVFLCPIKLKSDFSFLEVSEERLKSLFKY